MDPLAPAISEAYSGKYLSSDQVSLNTNTSLKSLIVLTLVRVCWAFYETQGARLDLEAYRLNVTIPILMALILSDFMCVLCLLTPFLGMRSWTISAPPIQPRLLSGKSEQAWSLWTGAWNRTRLVEGEKCTTCAGGKTCGPGPRICKPSESWSRRVTPKPTVRCAHVARDGYHPGRCKVLE